MKRLTSLFLMLSYATGASASSVTFGQSWDGNPPGNLGMIDGGLFSSGAPDFQPGIYQISVQGGYSAYYIRDVVGFEGDSVCAVMAQPCTLQKPDAGQNATVLEVYLDRPWHLWGTSPSLGHSPSTGPQFAISQTAPGIWSWGFEDLPVTFSDSDFQDVFGTIRYLRPHDPDPMPLLPTPEPATLVLTLTGVAFILRRAAR